MPGSLRAFARATSKYCTRGTTGCHRFPLNNFKYFLTLFSKFFSSFPHGTCSLSVSRRYLALDEIYHQFRVCNPKQTRLLEARAVRGRTPRSKTGFSPSLMPCSKKNLYLGRSTGNASLDYNSSYRIGQEDLHFELLPLHSPLLGESLLVSFPPLNNMLKFSGYSYASSEI